MITRPLSTRISTRLARRSATGVLAITLGLFAALFATAAPAHAADPDPIRNVTVTPANPKIGDQLTTHIDWCAPTGAAAGDSFQLTLDPKMRSLPAGFDLPDPDTGAIVARATITPNAPWVITFTLTDYVATHDGVCGTAEVAADFDGTAVTVGQGNDFTSVSGQGAQFTSIITPSGPIQGDLSVPVKYAMWRNGDQGTAVAPDFLDWFVTTPVGPFTSATTTDTVPSGQPWRWDCENLEMDDGTVDANGVFSGANITPPADATTAPAYTCSPTAITVRWPAQEAGQLFRLRAAVSLPAPTDGAPPATFANAATVRTFNGTTLLGSFPVAATIKQATGSGEGQGEVPAAAGGPGAVVAPPAAAPAPAAAATPVVASGPELAATGTDDVLPTLGGSLLVALGVLVLALDRRRAR